MNSFASQQSLLHTFYIMGQGLRVIAIGVFLHREVEVMVELNVFCDFIGTRHKSLTTAALDATLKSAGA